MKTALVAAARWMLHSIEIDSSSDNSYCMHASTSCKIALIRTSECPWYIIVFQDTNSSSKCATDDLNAT